MNRATGRLVAVALLAALAVAWALPSDVVGLVAKQDDVLLGRYSESRFVGLALATLLVLPAAAMAWLRTRPLEIFARLALLLGSAALAFGAVSLATYRAEAPRYVEEAARERAPSLPGITRRRQPNLDVEMLREDVPGAARSYPNAPAGFPSATIRLTTDAQGFRNREVARACDLAVTGDSFAEGSMVGDEETWSERLGAALGARVYNVAVSGAAPRDYVNNLLVYGLACRPRRVIVLVYEGNDFKVHEEHAPERTGVLGALRGVRERAFGDSPLRAALSRWLVRRFGGVGRDAPLPTSDALSFVPVRVAGHAYAFEPRHLTSLLRDPAEFAAAPEWTTNRAAFDDAVDAARAAGAEPVFVWAPSKAHVVMPLVRAGIPDASLHAFARYGKRDLPPAADLAARVDGSLDAMERTFAAWCAERNLTCVSLTAPLRSAVASGEPVFFTYDPHWTRVGHALVARELARALAPPGAPAP